MHEPCPSVQEHQVGPPVQKGKAVEKKSTKVATIARSQYSTALEVLVGRRYTAGKRSSDRDRSLREIGNGDVIENKKCCL